MTLHRVSVRALVEFSLHGEDIRPGGAVLRAMQEGTLGHRARQSLLPPMWQSEVPLELTLPLQDEHDVLLSGRMDAFLEADVPQVEEIKLWPEKLSPPAEPQPAHLAQAVCYGFILCETRHLESVSVSVVYVHTNGHVVAEFPRQLTSLECREAFLALWEPWARRQRLVLAHERARDASLLAMPFPYANYRPGQREMAVQVYTAIRRGRRLFAQMPTGTGKSAAALFPALKAMGQGLTGRVYYLTARTTQRQGPLDALRLLRQRPLHLWTLVLDAKDRQCPHRTLCHPDFCPRAKGHFLRDAEAITELLTVDDWTPEVIREAAERHTLCPFELSLSLAELADLTVCDYNYALDPAVHIQRIFDRTNDVTLLIDEAHNLPDRLRDMLSGQVDASDIRRLRQALGRSRSRTHPLYKAMTRMLRALTDLPVPEGSMEGRLEELPQSVKQAVRELSDAFVSSSGDGIPWEGDGERLTETVSGLSGLERAIRRGGEQAFLYTGDRERSLHALALDVGGYFAEVTHGLNGVVCFSATLSPLPQMKRLLGGEEEDALFQVPSPFPPEHLTLLRQAVDTRYPQREASVPAIVRAVTRLWRQRPCRCMVFFPSFAYLNLVSEALCLPHQVQRPGMSP